MPFHMTVEGTTQGTIEGSCDQQGREGTILCQAFDHQISIPRDPQSGLPVGKRVHHPLVITKVFDKSSPKLAQALTSGERLSVELKWYRIDPTGVEEHFYTIKLEDAIVVTMKDWTPNCLDPVKESFSHMEDVAYTYTKIIWTWVADGIESEDSWKVPRA
jgi:type VI secretion system secreted protein Hcp